MEDAPTGKPLTKLAWIGLLLWFFFLAGLAGIYYYVGGLRQGGEGFLMVSVPLWLFAYFIVISVYSGFFLAKLAQGRWKYPWLWGISGGVITGLLIVRLPIMFSSGFLSVLIVSFLAPILSILFIGFLISAPRKATS